MAHLHLVPAPAEPTPDDRLAKVIVLRVRREARNDPRPPVPDPVRPQAA
jgi:hypothetical protein